MITALGTGPYACHLRTQTARQLVQRILNPRQPEPHTETKAHKQCGRDHIVAKMFVPKAREPGFNSWSITKECLCNPALGKQEYVGAGGH